MIVILDDNDLTEEGKDTPLGMLNSSHINLSKPIDQLANGDVGLARFVAIKAAATTLVVRDEEWVIIHGKGFGGPFDLPRLIHFLSAKQTGGW